MFVFDFWNWVKNIQLYNYIAHYVLLISLVFVLSLRIVRQITIEILSWRVRMFSLYLTWGLFIAKISIHLALRSFDWTQQEIETETCLYLDIICCVNDSRSNALLEILHLSTLNTNQISNKRKAKQLH